MDIKLKITRQENANFFNCNIDDIVDVDFETYVAAVTASELASGNLEACKAQAVAARSFAMSRGVLDGTPISDSSATAQACRMPRANEKKYPNPWKGAMETKGQVLWYGCHAASTVFSASNGGRTVSSKERWGGARAYLPAQDDPWDAAAGSGKTGHGVGMSQRGCKYAAAQGVPYTIILEFYYPNTTLLTEYGGGKEVKDMFENNEKTAQVIELAKACLGYPYVFGARGEACTPKNRKRFSRKDYPTIISKCPALNGSNGSCANCKWNNARIFDCRGFTFWVFKQLGIIINGAGATSQYNNSANWVQKGEIKDMPNVVCCVFKKKGNKMAHTGIHIGNGTIIDCSVGVRYVYTSDKTWTHYAIPNGLYNDIPEQKVIKMKTVKRGSRNDDVLMLQQLLNMLGYDCGSPDGAFGTNTENAVRSFQADNALVVDGIVGQGTWTKLLELTERPRSEELGDAPTDEEPEQDTDEETPAPSAEPSIAAVPTPELAVQDLNTLHEVENITKQITAIDKLLADLEKRVAALKKQLK